MKKSTIHKLAALLLALCLMFTIAACGDDWDDDWDEDDYYDDAPAQDGELDDANTGEPLQTTAGSRDYRVRRRGGGEDTVTLMFYLCGSDLETESGAASEDLNEIMAADISDKLNIVVETGGSRKWFNRNIDPGTNERWLITNEGMQFLEDVGIRDMSAGSTLQDFITFSAANYPADRYMLVMWDHGGGTVDGCIYDERFSGEDMMPITELNSALRSAGVVFDMIGFDCCLMGTAETAFMVEKYADFMVASQRVVPGEGWYYTPWIAALSQNTSIPTAHLGQSIVDSFISASSGGYYGNELTMSVIDLTHIPDLFEVMGSFFAERQDNLVTDSTFIATSQALGFSRAVNDNYDLVDLRYLISSMDGSEELLSKLNQCVVYNAATIADHNGLCLYFPYTDLSKVGSATNVFSQIGIDDTYREFITTFANVMVGGRLYSDGGDSNPLTDALDFDEQYWLELDWVEEILFDVFEEFYEEYNYDSDELEIFEKGDEFVLSLSDDWDLITRVEMRVFLDDGEGYIDLGADNEYEFDADGDLLITFDNTWVALDGELVCFYVTEEYEEGNFWYVSGVVPIYYQDRDAELMLIWDSDNPYGYVAGWRYTDTGSGSQKGLFELHDGMTFDFLCDYYTYDGEYEDQYLWGGMTVNGEVEVSYEDVGDDDTLVYYMLYDIYGNTYWTEAVIFTMDWN